MDLDVSEFFIAFILKDFCEESDFVVVSRVSANSVDDSCRPLDDQAFQTILLDQVGVHELFHSLDWKP